MTSEAKRFICKGLDGRNPQHFLATLGLQKIASELSSNDVVMLSWEKNGSKWNPVLIAHNVESVLEDITNFMHYFSRFEFRNLEVARDFDRIAKEIKRERDKKKKAELTTEKKEKEKILAETKKIPQILEEDINVGDCANAFYFSETIGTEASHFRKVEEAAQTRIFSGIKYANIVSDEIASFASSLILNDKKVTPTVFSFSNGNSGKCLLKDARNCMSWVTKENLKAALDGEKSAEVREIPTKAKFPTPLNWSPEALVSHALSAEDPAKSENVCIPAIEALSFWGLSQFTCFPTASGLVTPCLKKKERSWAFCWPIWNTTLSPKEVFWLLTAFDANETTKLNGVVAEFQVRTVNPNGKRNYFSASYLPEH